MEKQIETRFDNLEKYVKELENRIEYLENLLYSGTNIQQNKQIMEEIVNKTLFEMKIYSNNKGYNYLKNAILICLREENKIMAIYKVYEEIAGKNETYEEVEEIIREIKDQAFKNNKAKWEEIFGNSFYKKNSEFIYGISKYIKRIC